MRYNTKTFNTFNKDLKLEWESLEDGNNPFSTYAFHKSIYETNIKLKKKFYNPIIFCIYELNGDIAAILPLEEFFSSKTLIFHGSEFADYCDFIFSKNIGLNSICLYIKDRILKKYDLFLHSFEKDNEFLNILSNISRHKFSWRYSKRFFIDKNDYQNYLQMKKKFIKKNKKSIQKNKLSIRKISTLKEKLKYLSKHIEYKSIQYKLTNTRNPFKNERYKKLIIEILKNFSAKIDFYLLIFNSNVVSILITFIEKNRLCYYQPSYIRNSNLESPGKILMYMSIRIAEEKGVEFDFSTGDENYKKLYSSDFKKINSFYLSEQLIFNFFHLTYFWLFYYYKNRNLLRKINSIIIKFKGFLFHKNKVF
tara:strand:+ start:1730 stop:2824 length:1095 start_codon:yes stop_codon:yes gene_type:complete